jgi:hypothetical protein
MTSTTPITARTHKEMADAIEVQINALAVVIQGLKRERDAHRALEVFYTRPAAEPLGSPLPVIHAPGGFDPDFDDPPPGQPDEPDEAAP